jgi:mRNA interferase MazF
MELRQYQIVLVNLDPTVGAEIKKTRPCVILSPNEMNDFLQTIVIAPMTSSSKPYPTSVKTYHLKRSGWIVLDRIRTIDRQRILKILDTLTSKEINEAKLIIKETYVD